MKHRQDVIEISHYCTLSITIIIVIIIKALRSHIRALNGVHLNAVYNYVRIRGLARGVQKVLPARQSTYENLYSSSLQ